MLNWPPYTPPIVIIGLCVFQNHFFAVAVTKQKYLSLELFPLIIGPNWSMGLGKTTVTVTVYRQSYSVNSSIIKVIYLEINNSVNMEDCFFP